QSVSGGNFENLVVGTAAATAHVDDTITDATVNLSASTVFRSEEHTSELQSLACVVCRVVTTIHTDRGDITIADGQTVGTLVIASRNPPESTLFPYTTLFRSQSVSGGNFENLVVGTAAATAHVDDTITDATVNLSASTVF